MSVAPQNGKKLELDVSHLLLFFTAFNLLFMMIDTALAHSPAQFVNKFMWVPVFYSPVGGLVALYVAIKRGVTRFWEGTLQYVMALGVIVGVLGFVLHSVGNLAPAGEQRFTLYWLVYGSPVTAPLSFIGVCALGLIAMLPSEPEYLDNLKRRLTFLLASLGCGFGFLMVAFDHAQNDFERSAEWIPLATTAFTFACLLYASSKRRLTLFEVRVVNFNVLLQIGVGLLGFVLHIIGLLTPAGTLNFERITHGAPPLGPLLFCDLGILAVIPLLDYNVERVRQLIGIEA